MIRQREKGDAAGDRWKQGWSLLCLSGCGRGDGFFCAEQGLDDRSFYLWNCSGNKRKFLSLGREMLVKGVDEPN